MAHDTKFIKSCNCNKKSCDYMLVLLVSRLGNDCEVIIEESCNKIQLLANADQCKFEGCVDANVYELIKE